MDSTDPVPTGSLLVVDVRAGDCAPDSARSTVSLRPVEVRTGVADLIRGDRSLGRVGYTIHRYQGVVPGSGLPIPGLHRIEGTIDTVGAEDVAEIVSIPLILRIEDGRAFGITLLDRAGRILTEERHAPGCRCC